MNVISSSKGLVDHVLMVVDHIINNDVLPTIIVEMANNIKPRKIIVLVNPELLDQLKDFLSDKGIKFSTEIEELSSDKFQCILLLSDMPSFTKWTRDPFVVLSQNPETSLGALPIENQIQLGNKDLAEVVINQITQANCDLKAPNWFRIHGGNLLVTNGFVLVGSNHYFLSFLHFFIENFDKDTYKSLSKFATKSYITIQEREDIWDNIQEYIKKFDSEVLKLLGLNNTVIIPVGGSFKDELINLLINMQFKKIAYPASPDYFNKALFDKKLWMSKKSQDLDIRNEIFPHIDMFITTTSHKQDGEDKEVLFLGKPVALYPNNSIENRIEKLECFLNAVEKNLGQYFKVIRNPMPLIGETGSDAYIGVYNNCLVENDGNDKNVLLPNFEMGAQINNDAKEKLNATFEEMKNLWDQIGFKVKPIRADFHDLLEARGCLHCLTNELVRRTN